MNLSTTRPIVCGVSAENEMIASSRLQNSGVNMRLIAAALITWYKRNGRSLSAHPAAAMAE
ncbi:MAG: hypothetical protein ACREFL_10875 [Stellaceae bacterium]